ncbi:probable cyclin-dependent serine/threonine-protein kinase DDB_G0292550 [Drosophila guanche]|uniref:probable cyclin-dependent serine/threonine-protein kinase DDB_G0292550 n=1 Tax=Drosophila guanche TaxID=7266 RepID=UPI00147229B3|nr:probable cyclin-dependent serine/threonine-protein kinase DDB_G0292550 [Drosophila guanche]
MTEFNANTVLWSLDDYIKVRKDEISINRKVKQKKEASGGTRQSAHLQSYKDVDLSEDEDDDEEFSFPMVEKRFNVDDDAHAANMNQLNFEKNDFDQLMYDVRTEAYHVDSIAEPLEAPNPTPPRPSVKSRLGPRPTENGANRGQQPQLKNHGPIQKRGGAYPNHINKRNKKRSNFNQRRVGATAHSGHDLSLEQKMCNANVGQLQNVFDRANNFQNNNFAHNGLPFDASANNNNLHFNNNNTMMCLNNQGLVNSNSNEVLLHHTQVSANLNNFGGMAQNQGAINSGCFGGGFQNIQRPVNLNSHGGLIHNSQGSANSNRYLGLLSNNKGSCSTNSFGVIQGTAYSSSYNGIFSRNNVGMFSSNNAAMFSNNANSTRPNIIENNWGISAEMRSKSPVNIKARQNRPEPSVKGNLEALLASPDQPKSGMFVGEALGMSLSDCKTADFRTVAQNVLFLLATADNDSQTKPDYGVVNKNVSQDRHF